MGADGYHSRCGGGGSRQALLVSSHSTSKAFDEFLSLEAIILNTIIAIINITIPTTLPVNTTWRLFDVEGWEFSKLFVSLSFEVVVEPNMLIPFTTDKIVAIRMTTTITITPTIFLLGHLIFSLVDRDCPSMYHLSPPWCLLFLLLTCTGSQCTV